MNRLRNLLNRVLAWRLREGSITLLLLALMLFSVTWAIQAAGWTPEGLWILSPITLVGLLTGLVLAKLQEVPRYLLHTLGTLVGILFIFYQMSTILPGPNWQEKAADLIRSTMQWVAAFSSGGASDDLTLFQLSLAAMMWLLAYSSAWFIFRSHWAWWAVVPNGVAILINLAYTLRPENLTVYFLLFVFNALLLLARFNLLQHEQKWERERVNYAPNIIWRFLRASAVFCLLVTGLAWYVPNSDNVNEGVASWVNNFNQPWDDMSKRLGDMFGGVSGGKGDTSYASFGNSFTMGGRINLSQNTALIVRAPRATYMRANAVDLYDGVHWRNTAADSFKASGQHANRSSFLSLAPSSQLRNNDLLRTEMSQTVTVVAPRDKIIFAEYLPVSSTVSTLLDVSWQDANADLVIDGQTNNTAVPQELRDLVDKLKLAPNDLRLVAGDRSKDTNDHDAVISSLNSNDVSSQLRDANREIGSLGERGIKVLLSIRNGSLWLHYEGLIPIQDDLLGVTTNHNLSSGETYSVISSVSTADEQSLRTASSKYPDWVTKRYLNLPTSVTERTRELAARIAAPSSPAEDNPYDKAIKIQNYLHDPQNYTYTLDIPTPPNGVDRVDYFLFDSKQGYCEYYAASMVVMLRSIGVPARMALGYAPGEEDPANPGTYIVKEAQAHTWPEVYFPNYGWIPFEPTFGGLARPPTPQTPSPSPTAGSTTPTPQPSPTARVRDADSTPTPVPTIVGGSNQPDGPLTTALKWAALPLIALIGLLLFLWRRENERVYPAADYYEKLTRWAKWGGLGPRANQTPFEYADQLDRQLPAVSGMIKPLARAYVRERYGKREVPMGERQTLRDHWLAIRQAIMRRIPTSFFKRK